MSRHECSINPSHAAYRVVLDEFSRTKGTHSWIHSFPNPRLVKAQIVSINKYKIVLSHMNDGDELTMLLRFKNATVLIDEYRGRVVVMIKTHSIKAMAKYQHALTIEKEIEDFQGVV